MTTETNGAVTSEAAAPQLKSTDTSYRATLVVPEAKPVTPAASATEATPVAPPADASAVPPEGDSDAPDAASQPDKRSGNEKRLPRWMKERLAREREVTAARTREEMLREFQSSQPRQPPVLPEAPKAKTLEDFDFDQNAYTDYLVDQKLSQREEARQRDEAQRKQTDAENAFKARVDAFEERTGDGAWEDILSAPINTDPAYKPLTELFMGDENDLDIAHHLALHPEEAARLKDLPRLQQVREIAKLAERFSGETPPEVNTPSTPTPLPKRTTSAPPPPKSVTGAGKPSVDINDPGLSTAQRIAAWRKAGKR